MAAGVIRSPLRYPGGKSRALARIAAVMPPAFSEYREPPVGGGSVFIFVREQMPHVPVWINDLNSDLYCFWLHAQDDPDELAERVAAVRDEEADGARLHARLAAEQTVQMSTLERAVRFFVLNRITFSGTVEAGGYSQQAFEQRFTRSSVERLRQLRGVLGGVRITNLDYSELLEGAGRDCFLYLDPPYLGTIRSKLYGRRGALHTSFDHVRFAERLRACRAKWLVTYDDVPEVRRLFASPASGVGSCSTA